MKPAVLRALAYAYATGSLPRKIHLETWSAAHALTEGHGARFRVRAEALAEVRTHPLAIAHDFLTGLGFYVDRGARVTALYVSYLHRDLSCEAIASRCGAVTLIRVNDARPFRQSWHMSAGDVAAAVAS